MAQVLGLAGVEIDVVEQEADGSWTAHVTTAAGQPTCCPGCGQPADRAKESIGHSFKHMTLLPIQVTWHKTRFWCANHACDAQTFSESGPLVRPKATVSNHARTTMGHLIGDCLVPVSQVAAIAGVSWHTAHAGFVDVAADAGIDVEATKADTQPRPQDQADQPSQPATQADPATQANPEPATQAEPEPATQADPATQAEPEPATQADPATQAEPEPATQTESRHTPGPAPRSALPFVHVLGIDEHRRGRPKFRWDIATKTWVADVDRWQAVFVDSAGGHGLLGQVDGRAKADVTGWLAAQDPDWRSAVRYVTIDMSTVFKSAALSGLLPNARVVVDPFHIVQLATKMVDDVRRRVTYERYGRRGRASDLEYKVKNLLRRAEEKLSKAARHKLLCALADLGDGGRQIGAAWRVKERVRDLFKLSPNRTGTTPSRNEVGNALAAVFEFAATVGETVPEIQTLAETLSAWRAEIARAVLTGHSNAATEGVNRLVKLVYRGAFGLTNVPNQQRRARYAASRATRPHWLHRVTSTVHVR